MLIFTDASYDRKTRSAGVACIISFNGNQQDYSEGMNGLTGSCEAEEHAILFAYHKATSTFKSSHKITIYSDCRPAIDKIINKNVLDDNVELLWISSHGGSKTPNTLANEHCDRLAKRAMRKVRDEYYSLIEKKNVNLL